MVNDDAGKIKHLLYCHDAATKHCETIQFAPTHDAKSLHLPALPLQAITQNKDGGPACP